MIRYRICLDRSFHFSGVNAWEHGCGSHGKYVHSFIFKKAPKYFSEHRYRFTFLPATDERPSFSTALPIFGIVTVLNFNCVNRYVVTT